DLMKQSMINIYRRIEKESFESKMLLQIHDELVFEVPPAELADLTACVREEMESVAQLAVPLKVDIHCGESWSEI
ncbi:MAG: DNA polymerase, partial [Pirellulales bacterium]|nr:DNA polymerase [Pirellulales bacterium]